MTSERQFSFKEEEIQGPRVESVLNLITLPSSDIGPALALSRHDIAVVVRGSADITLAGLAAVGIVQGQAVVLRHALVAVTAHDEAFARAVARLLVAAVIRDDPVQMTCTFWRRRGKTKD